MGYIDRRRARAARAGDGVERLRPVPAAACSSRSCDSAVRPDRAAGRRHHRARRASRRPRLLPRDLSRRASTARGGIDGPFVQDNHSRSAARDAARPAPAGPPPAGQAVRVIEGEIFDVAVDVRRGSPTFGRWVGVTLSARELPAVLRSRRLRARLLRDERNRAGRVQVHRPLRPADRNRHRLGRSRARHPLARGTAACCPIAIGRTRGCPPFANACRRSRRRNRNRGDELVRSRSFLRVRPLRPLR